MIIKVLDKYMQTNECPIKQAIQEQTGFSDVDVTYNDVYIFDEQFAGGMCIISLPPEVKLFSEKWDSYDSEISEFEFWLEIEKYYGKERCESVNTV